MRSVLVVGAIACAAAAPPVHADGAATDRCRAARLEAAAAYGSCRLQAERRLALRGDIGAFDAAQAACDDRLATAWQKAADRADDDGAACPDASRPLADYRAVMAAHTDALATALAGEALLSCGNGTIDPGEECDRADLGGSTCGSEGFAGGVLACGADCTIDIGACYPARFVDHGDGTVSDLETGLTWEKKVGLDGAFSADDLTRPHDADALVPWAAQCGDGTACQPSPGASAACVAAAGDITACAPCPQGCRPRSGLPGTPTAWQWLVALNDAGFAGHRDWRLPTRDELDSLLTFERAHGPGVAPALHGRRCGAACTDHGDPDCSCSTARTWTASPSLRAAGRIWTVDLDDTGIGTAPATGAAYAVRAVRNRD